MANPMKNGFSTVVWDWRLLRENFWPKFFTPLGHNCPGDPKIFAQKSQKQVIFLPTISDKNRHYFGSIRAHQFVKNRSDFCPSICQKQVELLPTPCAEKCQLWGTRFAGTRFHRDCSAVPRVPVPDGVRLFLTIMGQGLFCNRPGVADNTLPKVK